MHITLLAMMDVFKHLWKMNYLQHGLRKDDALRSLLVTVDFIK